MTAQDTQDRFKRRAASIADRVLDRSAAAARHIAAWSGVRRALAALLSGALSVLAMAPFHAVPVLFVTLPVLLILIDGAGEGARGVWRAAISGFLFGFGFFLAGLYWIGFAFLVDADTFAWMIPFVAILFPSFLALYWALAAAAARVFWRTGLARVGILACTFAVAEWLRGHLFTGFPWNLFGYAWTTTLPILQSTAFVGIYGLTFLTLLAAFAMACVADANLSRRLRIGTPIVTISVLATLAVLGQMRLASGPRETVPDVRLRIVQARLDQALISDRAQAPYIFDLYRRLSMAPGAEHITHVIWPEAAFPYLLTTQPEARALVASLLGPRAVLITGAQRVVRRGDRLDVFNSMHVVDGNGTIRGTYDKFHLVPFGEFLPFQPLLERLGLMKLTGGLGSFARGPGPRTLTVPHAPEMGPLICYEVIFPSHVVDVARRPAWLVNLTDDSWFGTGAGPRQHFDAARVRAVEEGLPVVRAANKGIAAIIGPSGEIRRMRPLDAVGPLDGPLPVARPATLYARFGDQAFFVLIISTLTVSLTPRR